MLALVTILAALSVSAQSCDYTPINGCEIPLIRDSPCFDTPERYNQWITDTSACECTASTTRDAALAVETNCAAVICPDSDVACAQACSNVYNNALDTIAGSYCACLSIANDNCGDNTTSTSTTNSTTSTAPIPANDCTLSYQADYCPVDASLKCLLSGRQLAQSATPITSNGCGADADDLINTLARYLLIVVASQFTSCCSEHDMCWGECSFGDDRWYTQCNSQFLGCMTKVCTLYIAFLLPVEVFGVSLYTLCLTDAFAIYSGVQLTTTSCTAYSSSQTFACDCVPCDASTQGDTIGIGKVTIQEPADVIETVCTSVSAIGADWEGLVHSVDAALFVANQADQATLSYFAQQIGVTNSTGTTSSQIRAVVAACDSTLATLDISQRRNQVKKGVKANKMDSNTETSATTVDKPLGTKRASGKLSRVIG